MDMKKSLYVLLLMGGMTPAVYAAGSGMNDNSVVQAVNQNTDETKLKELEELRKKYPFPEPKASESELKVAQMAVKMLMLQRTGDYTVTGADLWGEKVMNQHLRDVAKRCVRCHTECRNTVNQPKAIWIYIWIICLHTTFSFVCLSWYIATIVM